ncbi:MAG TPA: DMT family transporter, partial [Acidimicrobiales bacterium]|nr:DMT family transporter [Acidimicrobiales bacterium]
VMTAGLAMLTVFLDPRGGVPSGVPSGVPAVAWTVALCSSVGAVAALVVAGWRARGDVRAAFYGAATGTEFGLTAALMKGAVAQLSSGAGALFSTWQTYAMVAAGIAGMFLMQNAMQAGKLVAAQPGITLLDPFVAFAWGIFVFHEQTSGGALRLSLAGAGGLLVAAGALLLSRSPILEHGRTTEAGSHPGGATGEGDRSGGAGEEDGGDGRGGRREARRHGDGTPQDGLAPPAQAHA